jgi:hypothetical protein
MIKLVPLATALALCAALPSGAADRSNAPVFRPDSRPDSRPLPPQPTRPAYLPRPGDHVPAVGHPRPRKDRSLDLFIRGDESRSVGPDRR